MNNNSRVINIYTKIILVFITISVIFITIAYSSFSTTASIEEIMASVKQESNVRITSFSLSSVSNGGIGNSEDYNVNKIYGLINLPNADSTITYSVSVTVFLGTEMKINDIIGLDSNLEYKLTNYTLGDILCNSNNECNYGSTDNFYITIKYKNGSYNPPFQDKFALSAFYLEFYDPMFSLSMNDSPSKDKMENPEHLFQQPHKKLYLIISDPQTNNANNKNLLYLPLWLIQPAVF